ncbi:MAG: glycosyltransferase family 4 protein [Shimia sp.]
MHLMLTANAGFNLVNFRAGLIRALAADGHRLTALVPPSDADAALRAMGLTVRPLPMDPKGTAPHRDLALTGRILRALRRDRPEALLSWTIKNNVYGGLAARATGVPLLPNVTGLGTAFLAGGPMTRVAEALHARAFRAAPVVFYQNRDDRALFEARGLARPAQGVLLPGSGVDTARFAPVPLPGDPDAPHFAMVARLLRDKGCAEFAAAAAQVAAAHPGARFTFVGPMGAANRSAIDRATLDGWLAQGAVGWAGSVEDVRPAIAGADCVVLPSYREGMPRALLEAAAMGRPVIATDVPGCRDALVPGETGLLARVRDAGDLARAMEAMIALGPAGRAAMGAAGRARIVAHFDEALVVAAYRRALAGMRAPGLSAPAGAA